MATHSSILAWRIPWTEEPGRLQSMGWQESDTTEQLSTHIFMCEENQLTTKAKNSNKKTVVNQQAALLVWKVTFYSSVMLATCTLQVPDKSVSERDKAGSSY